MKRGVYVCNRCKNEGKEFMVPAGDLIGVELMKAHLWDEHKVNIAHRSAQEPEIGSYLDFA